MILISLLNQLTISHRLYENNDISLVDLRHATLVAMTALKNEVRNGGYDQIMNDIDSLLGMNGLTILCCYPEDLQRIYEFLNKTISSLIPQDPNEQFDQTLEDISLDGLDDVYLISEKEVSDMFDRISNVAPNNDKLAWRRLYKELQRHLIEYDNVNDRYLDIKMQRITLNRTINDMREKMVNECVHPKTELVYKGDHVVCKFCEKRLKLA